MIVYLDLDGVLANIHEKIGFNTSYDDTPVEISLKGFYRNLNVMKGAYEFVQWCLDYEEIDLYIATKIPRNNPYAATEKILWVEKHFGELSKKVFITPDKTKLIGDFLIDDDPKWETFEGNFVRFDYRNPLKSFQDTKKRISKKLNNSRELSLVYSHITGLKIVNNSNCSLRSLKVDYRGTKSFENIQHDESINLSGPLGFEENWKVRILSACWEDGQRLDNFYLEC
jgi:hypothetical protein